MHSKMDAMPLTAQLLVLGGVVYAQTLVPYHKPPVLLDCVVAKELGCFKGANADGLALPFSAGPLLQRSMNRDRSANTASGNAPERCAEFCATNYFKLSAVSEDKCTCGNDTSTSGLPVAGSKCASMPPAPSQYNLTTRQYTSPRCLDGTASCACSGNTTQACGSPNIARVFQHSCTPARGPGRYLCPLVGGKYMNGSDVSYKTYMDCFGQAKWNGVPWLKVAPLLGGSGYPTASFSMRPELALLCNATKNPKSWYCQQAVDVLRRYTHNPQPPGQQYHAYETVLTFQAVRDAGLPQAGLNDSELAIVHSRLPKEVIMSH